MKRAAKLLAISATVLSLGAAAQEQMPRHASTDAKAGTLAFMNSNPDSSTAWLLALGFLGLVVLRRTRSGPII